MKETELDTLLDALNGDHRSGDVAALRAGGLDDRAIHDICAITAYFAFVNRIADGVGVEVEPARGDSQ